MIPHTPRSLGSRATTAVVAAIVSMAAASGGAAAATAARPARLSRSAGDRGPTFEERVEAQRAIEQVYWSHRIWPEQNRQRKPQLSTVMPESALRAKVEDYLKKSNALESIWNRPIAAAELQAEMNRMAANTRNAQLLGELFAALGNDPSLIAETLARQTLVDRTLREAYAGSAKTQPFDDWWSGHSATMSTRITTEPTTFAPASITATGCIADTWTPLATAGADPTPRHYHAAVWTGAEMIVWGGRDGSTYFNSGGRYDLATDTWFATSTGPNDPEPRQRPVGVWTGTEMIVWGGFSGDNGFLNSGGRYNPLTDTWTATSTGANVPHGRSRTTGVWTGSEMIVWGGFYQAGAVFYPTDGGRYDPVADTWTATSMGANLPAGRAAPSSVWTGTEMIVWGGDLEGPPEQNTGGRYNPATDSWAPTSLGSHVPDPRSGHTVVWTGSEMIVWGGSEGDVYLQSGGRYNPATNSWLPTSTGANVPSARFFTVSVWSGGEMVIWGGYGATYLDTGGRYNPLTDAWTPTSTGANDPQARYYHSGVWTGTEMIVWSGLSGDGYVDTGGRYCTCAAPVPAYRDADGDGYGNAAQSIEVCGGTAPAGYVSDATDCDDGNAAVHPGGSESCNGLDDNCDGIVDNGGGGLCNDGNACTNDACNGAAGCSHVNNASPCDDGNACTIGDTCGGGSCLAGAPAPPPLAVEGLSVQGEIVTTLSWTGLDAADLYDIEGSTLSELSVHGTTTAACIADNLAGVSYLSAQAEPEPGDGYYYLVRATNVCGAGSYGVNSLGAERTRAPLCP